MANVFTRTLGLSPALRTAVVPGPNGEEYEVDVEDGTPDHRIKQLVAEKYNLDPNTGAQRMGDKHPWYDEPMGTGGRDVYGVNDAEPNWFEKFQGAVGSVPVQAAQSIKQLGASVGLGKAPNQRDLQDWEMVADSSLPGRVAGNVMALAIPSTAAAKGLIKVAPWLAKSPTLLAGILSGAESAGLTPMIEQGDSRVINGLVGAATGGAASAIPGMAARAVRPSDAARTLMDAGIQPTPGQGGTGAAGWALNKLEQGVEKVPGLGYPVQQARKRVGQGLVDTMHARSVPYEGLRDMAGKPGRGEYVQIMDDLFRDKYAGLHEFPSYRVDQKALAPVHRAATAELNAMPATMARKYNADIDRYIPKGDANPVDHQSAISNFRRRSREYYNVYSRTGDSDAKTMAGLYDNLSDKLIEQRTRNLPADRPELKRMFEETDKSYGNFKVMERAAANAGGEITPQSIIKATEQMSSRSQRARGTGRGMDLTEAAREMIPAPQTLGEQLSDKALRTALGGAGGYAAYSEPVATALVGLPVAGAEAAMTSKLGSKLMFGNTAKQKWLAEQLRGANRSGARAGVAAALGNTQPGDE